MEYAPKQEMQHDGLRISKFISSTIYLYYPTRIYLIFQLILQGGFMVAQVHFFIYKGDLQQFIQYAPMFFGLFYGILAMFILLKQPYVIENIADEIFLWSIDSSKRTTELKIRKEMKIVEIFTIANTITAILLTITMYANVQLHYELFLPIKLIIDNFPKYSHILTEIYKILGCPIIFTVYEAHCYQMIYYTQHIKYQILMLLDHVGEITKCPKEFEMEAIHPIDNMLYQSEIKRRLHYVIKRHQELLMSGLEKIDAISNLVVYFSICGVLAGICVLLLVVSGYRKSVGYVQIFLSCTMLATTMSGLIMAGQSIETVTDNVYRTQHLWYNMNCDNRKTLLNLMTGARKKIAISFSDKYSINFELALAIAKGVYSIFSVLISFLSK